jgi:hypothetical protein
MSCDLLLYWMSHLSEGSWAGFRRAVAQLAQDSADEADLARRRRVALSDLGYAEFFVNDSQRWRTLPSVLAGLPGGSAAVFIGSRTPDLASSLKSTAAAAGCRVQAAKAMDAPERIVIEGRPTPLERIAQEVGISFIPQAASELVGSVEAVAIQLSSAGSEQQPFNWDVESFDLSTLAWVKALLPNSACRFTPRYGPPKYLLHQRGRRFLKLPKRDAVYASAMLQGVTLIRYDTAGCELTVPIAAPLPEKLARIACLCSGLQPSLHDDDLVYSDIPFDIAAAVLIASGQPYPAMEMPAQTERSLHG